MKRALDVLLSVLLVAASVVVILAGSLQIQARLQSRPPTAANTTASATARVETLDDVELVIGRAALRGDPHAKLAVVEFSDFQCPFCARYFKETLIDIQRDYIAKGQAAYVFVNFPLESIHKLAFKAAEAAACAGDQGRYWDMHDQLFANQNVLTEPDLIDHARALGLEPLRFRRASADASVKRSDTKSPKEDA